MASVWALTRRAVAVFCRIRRTLRRPAALRNKRLMIK
jgi:hypothetical protein